MHELPLWLCESMNVDDYRQFLLRTHGKRAARYRRLLAISYVILIALIIAPLYIVLRPTVFGISEAAATYMRETAFYKFSAPELAAIANASPEQKLSLSTLLFIYWSCVISTLLLFIVLFISRASVRMIRRAHRSTPFRQLFVDISKIRMAIDKCSQDSTRYRRYRIVTRVRLCRPAYRATPFVYAWYKKPELQWFRTTLLDHKTRGIALALDKFDACLVNAALTNQPLDQFDNALEHLELYCFAIACRKDHFLTTRRQPVECDYTEFDALLDFSRAARPLLLTSESKRDAKARIIATIGGILSEPYTRNGFAIAGVAAIVMAIGVFFFKINLSQAFLAWFTVSFGSITISLGVSTVSLTRQKRQGHDNPSGRN